jgi:hypothetical protein
MVLTTATITSDYYKLAPLFHCSMPITSILETSRFAKADTEAFHLTDNLPTLGAYIQHTQS